MSANAEGRATSLSKLMVEAGLLALFFGALVFVAGWSYAERFFAEFGVNLSALEGLEAESIATYALWVFRDGWLPILLFLVAVLFTSVLVIACNRMGGIVVIALVAVASLVGAGWLGATRATQQVPQLLAEKYHTFVRVAVIAEPASTLDEFLGELGTSTCLRKIFMDRRNLYVYPGYESLREQKPDVYILPLSEIVAVQISRNPDLCQP